MTPVRKVSARRRTGGKYGIVEMDYEKLDLGILWAAINESFDPLMKSIHELLMKGLNP